MKHRPDLSPRMKGLKNFSSYVNLCIKLGHNFGCHMTPAEFYVSSDALVHLQVSTEYLIARAVEQLAGCLAQQACKKSSSRGQSTTDRQCQREGLKCIMNI